jgi:hypothetical protein
MLPSELLRDIVELAARNHPPTAKNIAGACFAFHQWVGPILFEKIVLHSTAKLLRFVEQLRCATEGPWASSRITRSEEFYSRHVRYLSILNINLPYQSLDVIHRICNNITTYETASYEMLRRSPLGDLRQLIYKSARPLPFVDHGWTNLTHIWLHINIADPFTYILPPNLQYLAIPIGDWELSYSPSSFQKIREIVQSLPKLQLLVIQVSSRRRVSWMSKYLKPDASLLSEIWAGQLGQFRDHRLILWGQPIAPMEPNEDAVSLSRQTGVSLWDRAVQEGFRHPCLLDPPRIRVVNP